MACCFPTARPLALERDFAAALGHPAEAQAIRLREILQANAQSAYGRRHGFYRITTAAEYQAAVPVVSYEDLRPEMDRILDGEKTVLTEEDVTRFHMSSGTSSASKLIPFTRSLQREFARSIELWLWNLRDRYPEAASGRSYWVISGAAETARPRGKIPVEHDQDAAYLPEALQQWFLSTQCVPAKLSTVAAQEVLLYLTSVSLLLEPKLALLSLWSPSFWNSLSRFMTEHRAELLRDFSGGLPRFTTLCDRFELPVERRLQETATGRVAALECIGLDWSRVWPHLALISVWTDGFAAAQVPVLRRDFPEVPIQGKGLLATEGIVTIPYGKRGEEHLAPVLVATAHFYEFRSAGSGKAFLAHELADGEEYEVLLTTGGGLYRYTLGDRVRVAGFLGATPRLRFVGKTGLISDLCGEKLHAVHVERVFADVMPQFGLAETCVILAPSVRGEVPCYRLFVASPVSDRPLAGLDAELESRLTENIQYAVCRRNAQLGPVEVSLVTPDAEVVYREHKARFSRLSTVKASCLDTETGWETRFSS